MVRGGLWWFVVVFGGSWWFVMVCGGLWCGGPIQFDEGFMVLCEDMVASAEATTTPLLKEA